jgi:hypothetical protein
VNLDAAKYLIEFGLGSAGAADEDFVEVSGSALVEGE